MKDAVAVVLKRDDRYLLIKRAKHGTAEDYWCPITGAVEDGETHAQAVEREAKEEMGITVEPLRKVWECPTNDREYLLHWWHAGVIQGEIAPNPLEVKEYGWFSLAQMENLAKMFGADRTFFAEIAPALPDS
ncbi:MAG: NUDIX hydrolase [candidate division WOR-3 bacterium]|nr:MAG: NUDIX hydrolase [candidate division WOR-3 bacterium]